MAINPFDIVGKTALITGAGSGLGSQFALVLSRAGADVICVDKNEASASEVADKICAGKQNATAICCDVSSSDSVEQMRRSLEATHVDILINNAGIVTRACRVHDLSEQDWDQALDVNLKGAFLCTKAILPLMLSRGAGSIINIASILGLRGFYPGFAAVSANYFASKAGIVGLTKQIAVEYAGDGIRANVICPAFHEGTALGLEWRSSRSADETQEFRDAIKRRTPMGRWGKVDELDGLIAYLASDASSYVTGQTFSHDGGWTAA